MYYAHSLKDEQFFMFSLFLKKAISGDNGYKGYVNEVIHETQAFISGKKDIYSVDRDMFSIVLFLKEEMGDRINKINETSIEKKDYEDILKYVDNRKNTIFA